jgi:hypothetical protein
MFAALYISSDFLSLVVIQQPAEIHAQNHISYSTSGIVALYPNTNTIIKFPYSVKEEDDIFNT